MLKGERGRRKVVRGVRGRASARHWRHQPDELLVKESEAPSQTDELYWRSRADTNLTQV